MWWAAVIKSVSAVFTFIFGKDYRLAMFGKNIKKNLFLLDESIVVTNNGSYGTIPKKVKETQWKYQVILTLINVFLCLDFSGCFTTDNPPQKLTSGLTSDLISNSPYCLPILQF